MIAMAGVAPQGVASDTKRRARRSIFIAAALVTAALIAGLIAFSWPSSPPVTSPSATATSGDRPGEHLNAPHIRF